MLGIVLIGAAVLYAASANALPLLLADVNAVADTLAAVGDLVDDDPMKVSTNRISVAVSVSTAVNGPDFPLPPESGVAVATAVSTVVAPAPSNKVTIGATAGVGIGATAPLVATALAAAYGTVNIEIIAGNQFSPGDPMFLELEFLKVELSFDPAISASRSYVVKNLTRGTTLFDSDVQGFPTFSNFGAIVGDRIQVMYDVNLSGSLTGPPGTDRQQADAALRSVLRTTAIPEPSIGLMIGIGTGLTAWRARRI